MENRREGDFTLCVYNYEREKDCCGIFLLEDAVKSGERFAIVFTIKYLRSIDFHCDGGYRLHAEC